MKYTGTVYLIVVPTGRLYIGSTMKPLKTRFSSGIGYKYTNPELYQDMKQYGCALKTLKQFTGTNYKKIEKQTTEYEHKGYIKIWYDYYIGEGLKPYNKSWGYRKGNK